MKKSFNSIDLKDEYQLLYVQYKEVYRQRHPNAEESLCAEYAAKMVRKLARKLYDYKEILRKIAMGVELKEVLRSHKSCVERGFENNYYRILHDVLSKAESVFDVGCGLNPAMVLNEYSNITQFYCFDKDLHIQEILLLLNEKYLDNRLTVFSEREWNDNKSMLQLQPDLLLAQKLISNLFYSRNIKMTNQLAAINAKYYFVTGCLQSLSRNVSIQEDENRAIEWFISRYGFQKIRYIETSNEFGWLLKKELYEP